ncbi:MAG TPA: M3 family oligoendopeptidase [Patescibacteria group bacterium]|jgi:oligoendopeptidase F|nr:M3 family oligoendopeptidase [Patescibacteria group bacterium]
MDLLPFGSLPPYRVRRFVPEQVDLGDWEQLSPLFDRLESRLSADTDASKLEDWLLDWSELSAALDEEAAKRYIAMTCHTDSAEAEAAYLRFVEKIEPQIKPRQFKLTKLYVDHPARPALPAERYQVLNRDTQLHVELFRPENVPLETEEAKLSQQYQKLSGSLTVNFRGEEKTLVQMGKYLEETDRSLRKESWELVSQRRLLEADKFDDIFDRLVALRQQIAKNAGYDNYRDYAFRKMGRFDYTPADCERFHRAVETEVMPVICELHAKRRARLGLDRLRPWDLTVDPLNRPPLRPFEVVDQMVTRTQEIFKQLDPELSSGFQQMQDLRLLDLGNRKGKAPGGYQSSLPEARAPFIFMNAIGVQRDVETILHEAGHAFHAMATRDEDLYAYRGAPIEFCEVASMSMELLGNEFLEKFYPPADADRARRTHLEGIMSIFPWIASVDAFQHWIYTHHGHTRTDREAAWLDLMDRFGGEVDWSGHDAARAKLWHRQLHIFIHAFYYIEYGIAQLGALQVWSNSRRNRKQALDSYKSALRLGGSRPLPELFAAAGCKFEFTRSTLAPLIQLVRDELAALDRREELGVAQAGG